MSALDDSHYDYGEFRVAEPKPLYFCANCGKEVTVLKTTVAPCTCMFDELRISADKLAGNVAKLRIEIYFDESGEKAVQFDHDFDTLVNLAHTLVEYRKVGLP